MASIRVRTPASTSRILRRTLTTTPRLSDTQNDRSTTPGSSSAGGFVPDRNVRTFEFLYGPESGWKKPRVPKRPDTPPKQHPKVDPEAYRNLPPLPSTSRDRVDFSIAEGQSNDRRAFFASDIDGEVGADWGSAEMMEDTPGLEVGRVVECRRSGQTSLGLILASIAVSGRPRLLLLRSSGEIWPISSHDVQFVMPSSLVPVSVAEQCWSPELIETWSQSESKAGLTLSEEAFEPSAAMMAARRQVAMTLRKIHRETEKMCGRLVGTVAGKQGSAGGAEGVWEKWAPQNEGENTEERTSITAVDAVEYILNSTPAAGDRRSNYVQVKPNTLPAYAAHSLLMRRPDLFTADQGDMWASGTFVVRSRAERRRIEAVQTGVDATTTTSGEGESKDQRDLQSFVKKAKKAIERSTSLRTETAGQPLSETQHNLSEWTASDKEFISTLLAPLVDTRSTQPPPSLPLAVSIARLITPFPEEAVDRGVLARMLQDMGIILPWDSLEMSKNTEAEQRSLVMSSTPAGQVRSTDDLLKGNELDDLREDYTSHKVFVIDDPTASELDDGIAVERIHSSDDVWIHIHIADPTRFIPPSHPLARQASVRGSSLYLPEGNNPLFPLEVIMKELSLGADVKRDDGAQGTMTFSARLSKSGEVGETKVNMGWIKKPRVITYAAADKALGTGSSPSIRPFGGPIATNAHPGRANSEITQSDLEDLRLLHSLAKAHRARRYATAGLEWNQPSASISLLNLPSSPNANIFSSSGIPSSPRLFSGNLAIDYRVSGSSSALSPGLNSGSMVAEFMILAGRLAASFCHSRNIPVIYRGSNAPKPLTSEVGTLEDLLSSRVQGTGLIDPYKILATGWYRPAGFVGLSPLKHWIMGFDDPSSGYIRATSPLRRFDDILVHWQIKAHLAREAGKGGELAKGFNREEVADLVKRSDEGTKRAKRAGINAVKIWQNQVLSRHLDGHSPLGLPEGWEVNEAEKVDLSQELVARVAGSTESAPGEGGEQTAVVIESLGVSGKMSHPARSRSQEFKVGEEVKVKMVKAVSWPNPHITVKLEE